MYPDGESSLELQPGVVEEAGIGLRIRAGLARGEDNWHLLVVDEDEIEEQHFALREVERIQTSLGCLEAYRVEKVRDPSSKRYTRTWYAAEHDFGAPRFDLLFSRFGVMFFEDPVAAFTNLRGALGAALAHSLVAQL